MPQILDGNRVRDEIKSELRPRIAALPRPPGLAVVLVGNNPASEIYVRNKIKSCHDLGIYSESITPPTRSPPKNCWPIVDRLNARDDIDGILVQLPLPAQVDSQAHSAGGHAGERRRRLSSLQRRAAWSPGCRVRARARRPALSSC